MGRSILFLLINFFIIHQNICYAAKIDTAETVLINGVRQCITINGMDDENPVILFIHGGPGRSLIPFAGAFTKHLPEKFVVVQWDQRKTGETLKLNPGKESVTTELLKSDALEMVKYLLKKFHHKKIYLVSHSWGSTMGFDIAKKLP